MDRQKCKKVTDWEHEHRVYIAEWHTVQQQVEQHHAPHEDSQFQRYLDWLHSSYRVHLRPRWTAADILEEDFNEENVNSFDKASRLGYQFEHAPVADRIVSSFALLLSYLATKYLCYLIKFSNSLCTGHGVA